MGRHVRKRIFVYVRPSKIQIGLRFHAVWSESSLDTFWDGQGYKGPSADNEESNHNQTVRIRRVICITRTCLYNVDPLEPHFYIVKLGFTGVYIIFLFLLKNIDCGYSLEPPRRGGSNEYPQSMFWAEIWKISEFLSENFQFLVVKFSIYLNRRVFVMNFFGCLCQIVHFLMLQLKQSRGTNNHGVFYKQGWLVILWMRILIWIIDFPQKTEFGISCRL